jgi:hypothetical protein
VKQSEQKFSSVIHNRKLNINVRNSQGQTAKWLAFNRLQGNDEAVIHIRFLFNQYKQIKGQESKDSLK